MEKDIFWADQLATQIIKRKKYNYIDKKYKNPKTLTIKSSTSISGLPHIGNASDILRQDALVRALKDKKQKVNFIWVAEDMDPWRKVPSNIPASYKKYLGMPVSSLPCPEGCCKTYVDHFVKLFLNSLKESYGTNPKFISTSKEYKKGSFYKLIKKALQNQDQIKKIIQKYRKTPLPENYSIWKPICENCGKIITTRITDTTKDGVYYECKDYEFKEHGKSAYNKVKGCNHKGFSDIKKGNGKLLWKVEWATEWATWKVVLEAAGKEHFMPGSSFWVAGEICENIFDYPEPFPGKNPIQPYEYITVNHQKMSSSKGNVVATWEWPKFAPAEALRLLFLKKPNKQRDFKYSEIPNLIDELDKLEKLYFGKIKEENKKELIDQKRLFETSSVKVPKTYKEKISFSFLAELSLIYKDFKDIEKILKKLDHKISDKKIIKNRFEMAKTWMQLYAPEEIKFTIQEKPNKTGLNQNQISALRRLADILKKDYNEKELFGEFYNIIQNNGLKAPEFFKAAYQALINKQRGPKLASLILAIGKDKTRKILNQL